jgi:glutathione S-transferase
VLIDMAKGKHKAPADLALNPCGRVPRLEEDGFILYQSTAIVSYLEATRPTPPLVPGQALADTHVKLCDRAHAPGRHHHLSQALPAPKERWNAAAMAQPKAKAKAQIEKHLAIRERRLAGKQYLAADELGLADICYIPGLDFLRLMPLMENIAPPPALGGVARAAPGAAECGGGQAGRVTEGGQGEPAPPARFARPASRQ